MNAREASDGERDVASGRFPTDHQKTAFEKVLEILCAVLQPNSFPFFLERLPRGLRQSVSERFFKQYTRRVNSINDPLFIPKLYWILTNTDSLLSEKRSQGNVKEILSGQTPTGGHFSCSSLCFKERLSAKPLIWEWFFNIMQIKLSHFHKKGFALASFWKWEFLELGNGQTIRLIYDHYTMHMWHFWSGKVTRTIIFTSCSSPNIYKYQEPRLLQIRIPSWLFISVSLADLARTYVSFTSIKITPNSIDCLLLKITFFILLWKLVKSAKQALKHWNKHKL